MYSGTLVARDTATGNTAVVKAWNFTVQRRDTSLPSNGPRGVGCTHGKPVDDVAFDRSFTCDCSQTKYTGVNCEVEVEAAAAAAAAAAAESPWLVSGIAVGTIGLVLLLAGIGYRHKLNKARMAAFDFRAHLKLLKETGDLYGHDAGVPRELKRKSVTMVTKVGSGAFGEVWKAVLDESDRGGVPGLHGRG